jgi:hypothetical protein
MNINNNNKLVIKEQKDLIGLLKLDNDNIWYKYVFITYIFKKKFRCLISHFFFPMKTHNKLYT